MNSFFMKTCFVIAVAFISTGCAARYGCNAPEGKSCNSISQTYTETLQETSSENEELEIPEGIEAIETTEEDIAETDTNLLNSSELEFNFESAPAVETASSLTTDSPTKSAPRILRIWLAPWEDDDGDLHQPGYIYLQIDDGKWVY